MLCTKDTKMNRTPSLFTCPSLVVKMDMEIITAMRFMMDRNMDGMPQELTGGHISLGDGKGKLSRGDI